MITTTTNFKLPSMAARNRIIVALAALACLAAEAFPQQQQLSPFEWQSNRQRAVFARRAADDSRPLSSSSSSRAGLQQPQSDELVIGKFRAPAPEQVQQQRVPKKIKLAAQTVSASFRVADIGESSQPERIVHGVQGASAGQQQHRQRTVGAKMLVSDEGLNYPPSKLSADIYGNVAEIVTAPPEAVENDFLIPTSSRHQQQPPKARRSYNN